MCVFAIYGMLIKVCRKKYICEVASPHNFYTFNGAVKQIVICEQIFWVQIVSKKIVNLLEERATLALYDYFLLNKLAK